MYFNQDWITGKGLGWQPEADPKDRAFALRAHPDMGRVVELETFHWPNFHYPLDQGNEGTCVGYAMKHFLVTTPVVQTKPLIPPTGRQIYRRARDFDSWPNKDDYQAGTSLNAGMKSARDFGFITHWDHIWNETEAKQWLAGVDRDGKRVGGPLVLGLPWYWSMFQTREDGFFGDISGSLAGYHAFSVRGYNVKEDWYNCDNSWGVGTFGRIINGKRSGRFRITGDQMRGLFGNQGHGVVGHEIKK